MRILCYGLMASLIFGGSALAKSIHFTPIAADETTAESETQDRLDKLFFDLKRARAEKAAQGIASRIWQQWFRSGSDSIDLMMQWSNEAVKTRKFAVALDFLDQVVTLAPEFAEGWNRRATLHFMMNNYAKSMADIQKTLELEPRHFGALAGMGMIMKNTGRKKLALEAYERVLDVYPMMRSAQQEVQELSEELTGEGI